MALDKPDDDRAQVLKRPTNIEDMKQRLSRFRSAAAVESTINFPVRASDVFVATYSKSGTTWMQQIVHQLRSGGASDYSDLSLVVPWFESAVDVGINPRADQPGGFRAFKSHFMRCELPNGARYITVFRNPEAVLLSFYHFFEGWWFEPGSITLQEFARGMYMQGSAAGRHWDHYIDWWPHVHRDDTLVLCYEDMLDAPQRVPEIVAQFLNIDISEDTMATVVEQCSRQYMLANRSKFEENLIRQHRDTVWGLPPGGDSTKVAEARPKAVIDNTLLQDLDDLWQRIVTPALGFRNYAQLRDALNSPLTR